MSPIKAQLQGMQTDPNSGQIIMNLGKLDRLIANTNVLHGDGFFPFYKDKMAKVIPGTGLTVKVADYLALIDGAFVFSRGKDSLDWTKYTTVPITLTGEFYLLLKPQVSLEGIVTPDDEEKVIIAKKGGIPQHTAGVFYCSTTVPEDGAIVVAKLNVPQGTTQITESMIDNSVKKWLFDIDKLALADKQLKAYIDSRVEGVRLELYAYILNQLTPAIRQEIAQGDQTVLNELNTRFNTLQSQINDIFTQLGWVWDWTNNINTRTIDNTEKIAELTTQITEIKNNLTDLTNYINDKISTLTTRTEELQNAVNWLNAYTNENRQFINAIYDRLSLIDGDITTLFAKTNELNEKLIQMDSDLRNYINEKVAQAEARIMSYLANELTPTLISEIAQGDQNVINTINSLIGSPSDSPDINGSTLWSRINFIQQEQGWQWDWSNAINNKMWELYTEVSSRIENLESRSTALESWYANLQNWANQTDGWKDQIVQEISKIEGDLTAHQVELNNHLQRIERLETQSSLQQGIFELTNAINIAKTNFKIDAYHYASANDMYKGWIDTFNDNSNIDPTSTGYVITNNKLIPGGGFSVQGLVGYWAMDEGQGTVVKDESGNGNDGLIYNGATWVDGKYRKALSFDGIDDVVIIPASSSLALPQPSVAAWIKIPALPIIEGTGHDIFRNGPEWYTWIYQLMYVFSNPTSYICWNGLLTNRTWINLKYYINLNLNQWYHIVGVHDTANGLDKLYLNGILVASTPNNYLNFGTTIQVSSIGNIADRTIPDFAFNGVIDEVAVFNKPLSDNEVQIIYQQGIRIQPTFPVNILTKVHNFGIVPTKALLIAEGSNVVYQISRDNGTTWTAITPNEIFTFTNEPEGQDIRLKFILNSPDSFIDNYALFIQ